MMQWHTQSGKIATNLKGKTDFTLPELSLKEIVMWYFHVDESAKGGYDMILGSDLWTVLGLNLKLSDHMIESYDGTFKGSTAPMVDLGKYWFKYLETVKITLEE